MACLHVKQIRKIHRQPRLGDALDEAIRESVGAQSLERANTVTPLFCQRHAVAADQLESGPAAVVGAHLETRCEDEAVELVGHSLDDDAGLGDALHSATTGINQ